MLNKRSQVDVAIIVGSIIVPLGAILGSLVFTWATLGPLTDAGATAILISHDISGLIDAVYSVPEDIEVLYSPPSMCDFSKNSGGGNVITCFNRRMNITDLSVYVDTENVGMPVPSGTIGSTKMGTVEAPMKLTSFTKVVLDSAAITEPVQVVSYPGFANFRDKGLVQKQNINLPIESSYVSITKTKGDLYSTVSGTSYFNVDPVKEIARRAVEACEGSRNINKDYIFTKSVEIPSGYYIKSDSFVVFDPHSRIVDDISLHKVSISPNVANNRNTFIDHQVSSFDMSSMPCHVMFVSNGNFVHQLDRQDLDRTVYLKFNGTSIGGTPFVKIEEVQP